MKVKFLVLGAGPSGLAFAWTLKNNGIDSFLILEKEKTAGGLCRSKIVDGKPLDIGGGHFLDDRNALAVNLLTKFLPLNEWNRFNRLTKIDTGKFSLDYPYEANIWQLPLEEQIAHLISISNSGKKMGKPEPKRFDKWIVWKLGEVIAENYMLPYNKKIFGEKLHQLGTYWMYKLPDVSFEEVLRSCLENKPYGKLPAHATFLYPKAYGYNEPFERMADYLKKHIIYEYNVKSINCDDRMVNSEFQADKIITTIPWMEISNNSNIPQSIMASIERLKYSSIDITYSPNDYQTNSHWEYFSDPDLPYHRKLYRKNFIPGGNGYWMESNPKYSSNQNKQVEFSNEYAYPINTYDKRENLNKVLQYFSQFNIFGLGRWGLWEHMNSDVAISNAINFAEQFVG